MKTRSHTPRESIEEMIATGKLRPGEHLDETVLANQFNLSRTPIREALIQLAAMGLVVIRPHKGAVVAEIPPQRLIEMFEVMAELEAMCARLAARRMSKEEQIRLAELHDACRLGRDNGDPDEYYYKNEAFHEAIYAGSQNVFLAEQVRNLRRRLRPYRRLQLRVPDRVTNSFSEHEDIVRAILARDSDHAADLLRDHILIQGQRFSDLMSSLSQLTGKIA